MSNAHPTLRRGDGFRRVPGSPGGQAERGNVAAIPHVRRLQEMLYRRFRVDEVADGLFGAGTEKLVIRFQREAGLDADGVVGPATWRALKPSLGRPVQAVRDVDGFGTFHGDLHWVHQQEGHNGRPYWPGGASGVTLDPGVDLGQLELSVVVALYPNLTAANRRQLGDVQGLKGKAANEALKAAPKLRQIRISKQQALSVMPTIAVKYWKAVSKRFPRLADATTPGSVQTALLSIAYNRGSNNKGLEPLSGPIERAQWTTVAKLIGGMQQDHSLAGIRARRRREGELILAETDFA